jgi:cold shock CspA family protein
LDYVLLGTGDGDFLKVVRALQSKGKRVDLLGFNNVSSELRHEVDYYYSGFLMPGILPASEQDPDAKTGFMHYADEVKGFGFITMYTGLKNTDYRDDIFVHKSNVRDKNGAAVGNLAFGSLKSRGAILEFDVVQSEKGFEAKRVSEIEF